MKLFPSQKYWEILPSKNLFFCGGRCISAPNVSILCVSFWLIVITSGLFFAFDCRLLIQRSYAILIFGILLFISVVSLLLKTAFTDPGIIPRASVIEAEWLEDDIAKSLSANNNEHRPQIRVKEVIMKGQLTKMKYCTTCKMFRPPRASHCSLCDNCVDRFDHHCPWVGNCIGRRNYRYFFLFNLLLTIYCLYILGFSLANIVLLSIDKSSLTEALKISPTSVIVIIISFVSMTSVIGLSGFHSHLICQEISTNEDIKGSYKLLSQTNPYSKGNGCKNCAWILCGPRPPSLLNATQSIDFKNLPVGCSYRGPDGCTIGPVGPSKTIKPYLENPQSSDGILVAQPMAGPPEFQNVPYPRQMTYHLTNGDAKTNNGMEFEASAENITIQNYGTISSNSNFVNHENK